MPSFLDKLRNTATGNTASNITAPSKKDPKEPVQTWLQILQQDPASVREDGNDKFFGAENFGNTCYFNSILQCLYYSTPFRELVLNYPYRSPTESVLNDASGNPRIHPAATVEQNGQAALSPNKGKPAAGQTSARSAGVPANPNKPEDKDSPEYKKKQAMLAGPILSLDYDNSTTYGMEPSLFTCLKDLFEAIIASNSRTGVTSPKLFLKMLQDQNEMFRGAMHQDAHEFLNLLLNAVVDSVEAHTKKLELANGSAHPQSPIALKDSRPDTKELGSMSRRVHDLFEGTLTSETKCLTCENVSQRDEPFIDLSVDLENHCSVTSCLRKFSEEEMLCERDKFFCDNCGGLQEAEKRMKIKRLPKTLALHLKRFKYTEDYARLQKLFHRVVYPYHLRLFNTTDDAEDPDRLYELYAVVVHIGSGPYHGHYVSIIKTPDRGWLLFDDEMVEPVDKSFVRNFFGAQVGMACAYVLFYQETTLEAVKKEQEAEGLTAQAAAAAAETVANADPKDTGLGLTLKTNGHAQVGVSPLTASDEDDGARWANLAHAATAPNTSAHTSTPLTATHTSGFPTPNFSSHTPTTPNPSASLTKADKKAAAKGEKERKQAEKAAEKAAKEEQKAAEKEQKAQARRKSIDSKNKTHSASLRTSMSNLKRRGTNGDPLPEAGTLSHPSAGTSTTTTTSNTSVGVNGNALAAASLGGTQAALRGATSVPTTNLTPASPVSPAPTSSAPVDAAPKTSTSPAASSPLAMSSSLPATSTNTTSAPASHVASPQAHPQAPSAQRASPAPNSHIHAASFSASGSSATGNPLNRFRTSSKSISMKKGKLWGLGGSAGSGGRDSKDIARDSRDLNRDSRHDDSAVDDLDDDDTQNLMPATPSGGAGSASGAGGAKEKDRKEADRLEEMPDKNGGLKLSSSGTLKKRGFSLRKKASSLLS